MFQRLLFRRFASFLFGFRPAADFRSHLLFESKQKRFQRHLVGGYRLDVEQVGDLCSELSREQCVRGLVI